MSGDDDVEEDAAAAAAIFASETSFVVARLNDT